VDDRVQLEREYTEDGWVLWPCSIWMPATHMLSSRSQNASDVKTGACRIAHMGRATGRTGELQGRRHWYQPKSS
jgi:hypothetical protein